MMWEKTVMDYEQISDITRRYDIAKAQAEITWDIAYKKGYEAAEEELGQCYAPVFKNGKKAGKREVVEWMKGVMNLERCDPDVMPYFTPYYAILEEDWQAFLKGLSDDR